VYPSSPPARDQPAPADAQQSSLAQAAIIEASRQAGTESAPAQLRCVIRSICACAVLAISGSILCSATLHLPCACTPHSIHCTLAASIEGLGLHADLWLPCNVPMQASVLNLTSHV
jgi:hypothetical protein